MTLHFTALVVPAEDVQHRWLGDIEGVEGGTKRKATSDVWEKVQPTRALDSAAGAAQVHGQWGRGHGGPQGNED